MARLGPFCTHTIFAVFTWKRRFFFPFHAITRTCIRWLAGNLGKPTKLKMPERQVQENYHENKKRLLSVSFTFTSVTPQNVIIVAIYLHTPVLSCWTSSQINSFPQLRQDNLKTFQRPIIKRSYLVPIFGDRFRKFPLNGNFTSADSFIAECRILAALTSW